MMPLEIDWAIYKRLVGAPLDSSGRPQTDGQGVPINRECIGPPDLNPYERIYDPVTETSSLVYPVLPSYGIRVPLMKGPNSKQGLTSYNQDATPLFDRFEANTFRQVPVFDQNLTGRKIEDIWPCVTFRWFGMDFDSKVFVYHDPFGGPDTTSSPVDIKDRNGNTVQSGYEKNYVRPHPESWPMMYAITAYAKSTIEMALICSEIARLFPARGGLNVQFASGEIHTCDMLLQRTETLDEGGNEVLLTRTPDEQRGLARAFVYTVESYLDNTVNKYGARDIRSAVAVRERILELDQIMGDLIVQGRSEDLNLGELKPITV